MNWKRIVCIGLFLIIIVPVAVNFVMQIELPWNIVYEGDWLGFFGAFFGAIFTVIGALFVVHLNTKKENNHNYLLELHKIKDVLEKFIDERVAPKLDYDLLVENPILFAIKAFDFLNNEYKLIFKLDNDISKLKVYNPAWENTLKELSIYIDNLFSIIEEIVHFNLSSRGSNLTIETKDHFYKKFEELGITSDSYYKKNLEKFMKSCRDLLDSEIDRMGKSFRIE